MDTNTREIVDKDASTLVATPEMCIHAFDVIINELQKENENSNHDVDMALLESIPADTECPLFVTWDKKHRSDFRLRGCIGTLAPQQLIVALGDYAVTSAFRDHRFNPISSDEVKDLRVGISLLVNYEKCDHCFDWQIGIHGIIIKFYCPSTRNSHNGKFRVLHFLCTSIVHFILEIRFVEIHMIISNCIVCNQATFLPEVAEQQEWTKEQTVEFLVRKSGYNGQITEALLSAIECTRYQSSKKRMVYDDYVKSTGKDPLLEAGQNPKLKHWRQFFHK